QASDPLTMRVVGPPIVDAVDPAGGSSSGGTKVTVHGPNLEAENGDVILLDGQDLNAVFASPGFEFTAPAHAPGIVNLVVRDMWGQQTTVDAAYEFNEGAFVSETQLRLPAELSGTMTGGLAMAFGDVNRDGYPDIVLSRERASGLAKRMVLLVNDGQGNFTDRSVQDLPPTNADIGDFLQAAAVALGDLDGNGDLDIVAASESHFFNPGEDKYSVGSKWYIVIDRPYPSTRVFLNNNGKFTLKADALPDVKAQGADLFEGNALALGDVDGNGTLDIVLGRRSEPRVTMRDHISGTGSSYYPLKERLRPVTPPEESTTIIRATRVLLNSGSATFTLSSGLPATTDGDIFAADALLLGDADDDGEDMDIILTVESDLTREIGNTEYVNKTKTGSASKTRILTNDGDGDFTNETQYLMPAVPSGQEDWSGFGLALGDIDGDGTDDLVVTTNRDDLGYLDATQPDNIRRTVRTRFFIGGSSGFTDATQDKMPSVPPDGQGIMLQGHAAAIADVDRDGKNDLVITTIDQVADTDGTRVSATRVLLNTGDGVLSDETLRRLPNAVYSQDDLRAHALILGAVDDDVDLDLILTTEKPVTWPTRILIFE
ncbi:MAG: FG-GAP-like repeat-containing protein, partial [Planctomycetota bacterium]